MAQITSAHFGGNVILTRDSLREGTPFGEVLKEIDFSNLRYPGGGVTEDQTWENGGLDKMFGAPMEPGSEGYVLTIHEALEHAAASGTSLSIVTPTFQFYDKATGTFDAAGFDRYLDALEGAIKAVPDATISHIEIGNEYWGSKQWGGLTGGEYGAIANAEIPQIHAMIGRLSEEMPDWEAPSIGVQAGVQWKAEQGPDGSWTAVGPRESEEIIAAIDIEHREMVGTVFQHSYPNADEIAQKIGWAVRPMEVFEHSEGFGSDLTFVLSEFNIGAGSALGVDQAGAWIEALHHAADSGVDAIDHWGIAYEWLSNKFYDTKFPPGESDGGEVVAIATPMGQVYDIAQSHLVGKSTQTDAQALEHIGASEGIDVTGFGEDDQQIVFLHNGGDESGRVDLSGLPEGMHVSVRHIKPADSPESTWFDESARELTHPGAIADSRADMHVSSERGVQEGYDLGAGEMLVVVVSDPSRDLVIEGAHHATDPASGMVDDLIVGGEGNDILRGHVGNDTIEGGGGRNILDAGKGDDLLVAGDEGDILISQAGSDTLEGGEGDDMFVLGSSSAAHPASSEVSGGGGQNLFLIGPGHSTTITDASDQDLFGFTGAFGDASALEEAMQVHGEDLVVEMPDGTSITLAGYGDQADLLAGQVLDFMDPQDAQALVDGYLIDRPWGQLEEMEEHGGVLLPQEDGAVGGMYFDAAEVAAARLGVPAPGEEDGPVVPPAPDPDSPDGPDDGPDAPDSDTDDDADGGGLPWDGPEDEDEDIPPHDDGYEEDDQTHDSSTACFVATAAFGDGQHPDVVALRAFRDHHLARFRAGRAFIAFYWVVGPRMAAWTRPHQPHAAFARRCLSAMVRGLRRWDLTRGR